MEHIIYTCQRLPRVKGGKSRMRVDVFYERNRRLLWVGADSDLCYGPFTLAMRIMLEHGVLPRRAGKVVNGLPVCYSPRTVELGFDVSVRDVTEYCRRLQNVTRDNATRRRYYEKEKRVLTVLDRGQTHRYRARTFHAGSHQQAFGRKVQLAAY